ncbi:TAXI family TRAP transporter solute-binding subunit [Alkalihalobacterium bogoriense]|uniref:TAXI family TRAP transporter solute-binding subunit n=1 Tax=Alkalihalobacterium bogoriense TaxID=246272 RepID=UPI00047D61C8|nr:TAXI family TRAP transporter solute-binding subunit [Alkalihalobacterium bogoriense]
MKKLKFLFVSILATATLAACGGGDATELQMGTGSTGGTYYPLGQEMATVMNDNVDVEGFNVSAVASGASVENLAKIGRGEFQLGMTVHLPALDAANGEGEFADGAIENFGFMGHIYPEVMQVVTTEGTGITSIADLAGKKVAIGPPGSGTQSAAKLILEAYGIQDGDYEALEEGFGDAAGRLQDGQLDASFGLLGLPAGNIIDISTQRDVVILPIEGEALDYIEANSGYAGYEIPADSYDFLDAPVMTVTAYAVLVGSTDEINEDLGDDIVKSLYENAGGISHQQGTHLTIENVLNGSDGLPMHPGAEKYFREIGILN